MCQIKAPIAGNSKAIAKIGNAELAYFNKQMLNHELITGSLGFLHFYTHSTATRKLVKKQHQKNNDIGVFLTTSNFVSGTIGALSDIGKQVDLQGIASVI